MSVADPREGTESADHDRQVRHDAHDQHRVVLHVQVAEHVDDLEEKP